MRIIIMIFISLISFNLTAWDKINYIGSDNISTGGAVAGELGDIDNIIVNPACILFKNDELVKVKLSGSRLFSGFEQGLYNYSFAAAYNLKYVIPGIFYGAFTSNMYSESVLGISGSHKLADNFIVGLSFILEMNSFSLSEEDNDALFTGTSLEKSDWYFNPGIIYLVNETLSIGLYSSEFFGKNFNFNESILGLGVENLMYENSKSVLNKIKLKLDIYTMGGTYQNYKAGIECYFFKNYLQVQLGYNRNNISFGIGFTYKNYILNLAYLLYNNITDFGNTVKATIEVKF